MSDAATDQKRHSVESLLNRDRVPGIGDADGELDLELELRAESTSSTSTSPCSTDSKLSKQQQQQRSHSSDGEPPLRSKTFAFVNISDPTQAGDADNRKFVRQYVRPVKKTKAQERDASHAAPTAAIGLESGALPFIVMSHPDQGSTAGARKFVKQNAQRRFRKGKARKPGGEEHDHEEQLAAGIPLVEEISKLPILREREIKLPFKTKLIIDRRRPPESPPKDRNAENRQTTITPNFWSHVDSSGAIFPVKMDTEAYRLVEYRNTIPWISFVSKSQANQPVHTNPRTTKVPPAFMPLWFSLILHDKSAFNGLMSLALAQQSRCHKIHTEERFIQFHSKALQSVQRRLAEPSAASDSGLMTSIVLFLIHDVLVDDRQRYAINHAGLRSIINMRGGIETMESALDQQIRMFILVAEVCGAISFNFAPEYYLPPIFRQLPPRVSSIPMTARLGSLVSTWLENFPERIEVVQIFNDFHALNSEVVLDGPNLWNRPAVLTPEAYFLITRLVYLTNHLPPDQPTAQLEKSFCVASIIYLNHVRDALGDYFTRLHHGMIERLMAATLPDSSEWLGFEQVRLWCLVQGGIVSSGTERKQFARKTREVMTVLSCQDWEGAMAILVDLVYIELVFEESYREFGKDVMAG